MLLSTQSVCARLRTLPIIMQIPRGYQKKSLLCRKSAIGKNPILVERGKVENNTIPFGTISKNGPSQRLPKKLKKLALSAACTKLPNAFNPFGTIRKQFLLCKNTKKTRYVRSLGKKPHFGAFPEAQKGVVIYAICLRKAAHSPNNNANPSGLSEKKVYCVESLRFCR